MKSIKTDIANLEKKRGLFFQFGLVFTLTLLIFAFEWQTPDEDSTEKQSLVGIDLEIEELHGIRRELTPPKPDIRKISNEIIIEENNQVLTEELHPFDTEANEQTKIEIPQLTKEPEEPSEFFLPDEMPEFPGGNKALREYIIRNLRYPYEAREKGIQGRVFVQFMIKKDGSIDKVSVIRSIDPLIDAEAIRVVSSLPRWKPGTQAGKPVAIWHSIPITFKIFD